VAVQGYTYRVSQNSNGEPDISIAGYAIGGFGPIVVAGALVAVRDDIEHTTAVLVLVVVVVLAAMAGGRAAGALGAVVAAASFDFFLTKPYLSLRISSENDIETTVVLLLIGVLVGQIIVFARRNRQAATRASEEIARMRRVAEQAASGASTDDLILAVQAELEGLLSLHECHFQREELTIPLPKLERAGTLTVTQHKFGIGGEFSLPPEGVELPVVGGGRALGYFVLGPSPDVGVPLEARIVAVALADQLGAALAASKGSDTPT
jgi:hypothetical protein